MSENPQIQHMIKRWKDTRDLCVQQLELIESGKIRFRTNDADTTRETIDSLHKVKREMEALIAKYLE